jgi:Icc-related predicted phosphoesterase
MKIFGSRKRDDDAEVLQLYYASDLHGSYPCWRKFLGAGKFYGAQLLIMGGDLTGKAIVPVERRANGEHVATFLGDRRVARTDTEVDELLEAIRYNGMYPWVASEEEIAATRADQGAAAERFDAVMLAELRRWMELADERLASQDVRVLAMAGNDDPWATDDVLRSARTVEDCDGQVVQVAGHEVLSCSYANRTPWDSPRELDEDALYARLKGLADQLERPERAIFNLHVPPYDSGLDRAAEVDAATMSYVLEAGQPREVPVGSTAVRQVIEEFQPLLSLHGHIHECRGMTTIGRTVAINPGSEYNSGRIHGALVSLADDRIAARQLVVG